MRRKIFPPRPRFTDLRPGFSPGKPVDHRLCQAATTPRDITLREIPLKNVDGAINVGMYDGSTIRADIQASVYPAGFPPGPASAAILAGVPFAFELHLDAKKPGLVTNHADDALVRPAMQSLVAGVAPVLYFACFVRSDVLQVTNDDGGDATSVSIVDKRTGQAVQKVGSLPGALGVDCSTLSGSAVGACGLLLFKVAFQGGKLGTGPDLGSPIGTGGGSQDANAEVDSHGVAAFLFGRGRYIADQVDRPDSIVVDQPGDLDLSRINYAVGR